MQVRPAILNLPFFPPASCSMVYTSLQEHGGHNLSQILVCSFSAGSKIQANELGNCISIILSI